MSHLSPAQLLVVKGAIAAETNPEFVGYRDANDKFSMALWFNKPSTTVVWRTSVAKKDVIANAAFDWTRVDNLSVGKARIWEQLFSVGNIDASQPNVRAGIDATWVGTAADLAVRASVYVQCKRFANRLEKLFAVGTGSDAAPATMGFEGTIDSGHIGEALEAV
jgi:hypothetical protein